MLLCAPRFSTGLCWPERTRSLEARSFPRHQLGRHHCLPRALERHPQSHRTLRSDPSSARTRQLESMAQTAEPEPPLASHSQRPWPPPPPHPPFQLQVQKNACGPFTSTRCNWTRV